MFYEIQGYWKDDNSSIDGYIVATSIDYTEAQDDKIFFYFESLEELQDCKDKGIDTVEDFVITDFKPTSI